MRSFFGVISVLTGGCSAFFTLAALLDGGNNTSLLSLYLTFIALGFGIAAIFGFFAKRLLSSKAPSGARE